MSLFHSGDSFQRTGPPRTPFSSASFSNDPTFAAGHTRRSAGDLTSKPLLKASSEEKVPESPPAKTAAPSSEKRQRSPDIAQVSDRPTKRNRQPSSRLPQLISSSSKPVSAKQMYGTRSKHPSTSRRRSDPTGVSSPEIIPDSDEENAGGSPLRLPSDIASKQPMREPRSTRATRKTPQKQRSSPVDVEEGSPSPAARQPVSDQEVDEDSEKKVPAHRARYANPRVKLFRCGSPTTSTARPAWTVPTSGHRRWTWWTSTPSS